MNKRGYYYEVQYRLDNNEDFCKTEYEEFDTLKEARKFSNDLIKEYGKRIVFLDIYKWNEIEWVDVITII